MLSLGPGIGPNRLGLSGKPLPKWLTDAGCTFAINVDRQVKALANPNSPLVNPLIDVVGKLGKNLVDVFSVGNAFVNTIYVGSKIRFNVTNASALTTPYFKKRDFKPNTQYTISGVWFQPIAGKNHRFRYVYTDGSFDTQGTPPLTPTAFSFTSAVGKTIDYVAVMFSSTGDYTEVENLQFEEGTLTTYEPYGFNNVLLQSFAGTTADGYTQIALPNGKNPWFLKFDGTDSFGALLAAADLNPTGTQDFAQLVLFKPDDTSFRMWGAVRNLATADDLQYGLFSNGANAYLSIANITVVITNALAVSELQWVLYGRINGRRFLIRDGVEKQDVAFANSITSQPNIQWCCRSNSADGLTKVTFAKGLLGANAFFYNGNNPLDKAKVIQASLKLMANYI